MSIRSSHHGTWCLAIRAVTFEARASHRLACLKGKPKMRSLRSIYFVAALIGMAACRGVGVGGSVDVETVPAMRVSGEFAYSAKFLCGTIKPTQGSPQFPDASRDTAAILVPGTYLTSINVLNPDTMTVLLSKRAVETKTQMASRGQIGKLMRDTLIADQGLYVDCADILRLLGDRQTLLDHFVEGFVVLRSRTELGVNAVYSFEDVRDTGV
jgi:hypothetical protein